MSFLFFATNLLNLKILRTAHRSQLFFFSFLLLTVVQKRRQTENSHDLEKSKKGILGKTTAHFTSTPSAKADWFTLLLHHQTRPRKGFEVRESCDASPIVFLGTREDKKRPRTAVRFTHVRILKEIRVSRCKYARLFSTGVYMVHVGPQGKNTTTNPTPAYS